MELADMNDDVLHLMLSDFDQDKRILLKLSKANLRLANLVRRHIFRHVDLRVKCCHGHDEAASLLVRSLEEDPKLKEMIHAVSVEDIVYIGHLSSLQHPREWNSLRRRWNIWPGQHRPSGATTAYWLAAVPLYPRPQGKERQLGFLRPHSSPLDSSLEISGYFTAEELVQLMAETKVERVIAEDFMMSNVAK